MTRIVRQDRTTLQPPVLTPGQAATTLYVPGAHLFEDWLLIGFEGTSSS